MDGKHLLRYPCEKLHWNRSAHHVPNRDVHLQVDDIEHTMALAIIRESQDGAPLKCPFIGS